MKSITREEWDEMSWLEKTMWLEHNRPANAKSVSIRSLKLGAGINDANYCVSPKLSKSRTACPAYVAWSNVIIRCYDKNYHAKKPTYIGVKLCDEWHKFSSFREWWIKNHVDGYEIDKDILGDGTIYSPDSCVFVPRWLNTFTIDSGSARGDNPIGVYFNKERGKLRAQCANPIRGCQDYLGSFDNPYEAFAAWRNRKLELAIELKPRMDEVDERIYHGVVRIINSSR